MIQCDAYTPPCAVYEPPTVVETTQVIQPPPRVVIVQPRVFVRPRKTVVINKPPIYECGSSWSGCPSVGVAPPPSAGPPPPPPSGGPPPPTNPYQTPHGEAFVPPEGGDGGNY